ncbi:MAG: hypothetical protein ABEH43_11280, partial [Flavobacteriales bacterium]
DINIIYTDTAGNKQQVRNVSGDWSKEIERTVEKKVSLEARSNVDNGSVRVKIYENNDLLKEAYDNSSFSQAEVSATVPVYQ